MGLRGTKPNPTVTKRNKRIWREYISLNLLGYYEPAEMYRMVAKSIGVKVHMVVHCIHQISPEGCYEAADRRKYDNEANDLPMEAAR